MVPRTWSMVVISAIDGTLRRTAGGSVADARTAVEALVSGGIPLVLTSDAPADDVRHLQRTLGITAPFVCRGGGALYIPPDYFQDAAEHGPDTWEIVRFAEPPHGGRRRDAPALHLLVSLFRTANPSVLIVGLGSSWNDRALLRSSDVPIIIRDTTTSQHRLMRSMPTAAFCTTGDGPAGWAEAILGSSAAIPS